MVWLFDFQVKNGDIVTDFNINSHCASDNRVQIISTDKNLGFLNLKTSIVTMLCLGPLEDEQSISLGLINKRCCTNFGVRLSTLQPSIFHSLTKEARQLLEVAGNGLCIRDSKTDKKLIVQTIGPSFCMLDGLTGRPLCRYGGGAYNIVSGAFSTVLCDLCGGIGYFDDRADNLEIYRINRIEICGENP